jgi:hypothetical protein
MNKIRISGVHYDALHRHLFPRDGKEAVAIALCGRSEHGDDQVLLVQELFLVPHAACLVREPDRVLWPTSLIDEALQKAARSKMAIVKIHCHPGYYEQFSPSDNASDDALFKCIHAWLDDDRPHASCIMLPDGRVFGRFFLPSMEIELLHQFSVAGSRIEHWYYGSEADYKESLQLRNLQAFGPATIGILSRMKIAVLGCSGTGSPTIEQLKRLGVGELLLVDPDYVDFLNLNRIIGSTYRDAQAKRAKTEVMEREIGKTGFGTRVRMYTDFVSTREIVEDLTTCDLIFSCVDGAEGRHIANLVSSFYLIPLIDMGVKFTCAADGSIHAIFGSVHFVQPGGSSLLSRGQYDLHNLRGEAIRRANQEEAARNQYLAAAGVSSPAVISINMQVSATAVNEFLARIHPYRNIAGEDVDVVRIHFADCSTFYEGGFEPCPFFQKYVGRGDMDPLLNNPEFSHVQKVG